MSKIIVVTSGKGGVGKTTTSASVGMGLALRGKKTCVIDFDIGLRNLDLITGLERRVVYDFVNVIQGDASLSQAIIRHRKYPDFYVLAASQTKDKEALTREGVEMVIGGLKELDFEYIICDSPAGIENGALSAMYFADEALLVTNPEISSVRDSDRFIGILNSKSRLAESNQGMEIYAVITRYDTQRVQTGEMMDVHGVLDILNVPLAGVIPEDKAVLTASNVGDPVILNSESQAGQAYSDTVARLLGEDIEHRFVDPEKEKKGIFANLGRLFRR